MAPLPDGAPAPDAAPAADLGRGPGEGSGSGRGLVRSAAERWSVLRDLSALPGPMRLIVICQLAFNLGFYLVLPFFAVHLTRDLALGGALVGILLGLRTFSQQGLFFLGGALADRLGTVPVAATGFVVRIAGFVALALAEGLPLLVAGTVAVGFAAALFSPAVEAELARRAGDLEERGGPPRSAVFAMFAVGGEIGAVLGPVLGSVLLAVDFAVTALVAAAVFAVILVAFLWVMPHETAPHRDEPILGGWSAVLRDRRFLAFSAAYASWLLCYNQLYLLLPVELGRLDATGALGALFALAAAVVVLGQLPLAAFLRRRVGARRALPGGFALLALAFLVPAAGAFLPTEGWWRLAAPTAFVVLLCLGQMTVVPLAQDAVGRLAGERRLGSYFGVLASAGGVLVLLGGGVLGALIDPTGSAGLPAALPWVATAALPAASAVALAAMVRRVPALTRA